MWTDAKRDMPNIDKALKPHKERSRQTVQKDIEAFVEKVLSSPAVFLSFLLNAFVSSFSFIGAQVRAGL